MEIGDGFVVAAQDMLHDGQMGESRGGIGAEGEVGLAGGEGFIQAVEFSQSIGQVLPGFGEVVL